MAKKVKVNKKAIAIIAGVGTAVVGAAGAGTMLFLKKKKAA
jgi:hypothetical protein